MTEKKEKKKIEIIDIETLVVNGTAHATHVDTSIGRFFIRPLSIGEKSELKFLPWKTLNEITVEDAPDAPDAPKQHESDLIRGIVMLEGKENQEFHAVAWGLSYKDKIVTVEKVRSMTMPEDVFNAILAEILKISEVSIEELKPFSGNRKRE